MGWSARDRRFIHELIADDYVAAAAVAEAAPKKSVIARVEARHLLAKLLSAWGRTYDLAYTLAFTLAFLFCVGLVQWVLLLLQRRARASPRNTLADLGG